jgi:hypothetical protein
MNYMRGNIYHIEFIIIFKTLKVVDIWLMSICESIKLVLTYLVEFYNFDILFIRYW